MYRAFIVDDDPATRDGLKNYFNWAKYDVEIIGAAPDGDVAYSRILELRPDILVSDVKMPRMDGTLLLQKLSAAGLRIAALFISGYSEVSLVKSAIQFVLSYLLLIILPVAAIILFSYQLSEQHIERSLLRSAEDTVTQVASNLSFQLEQMMNVGQTIASADETRTIMERPPAQVIKDYYDAQKLRKTFTEAAIVTQGLRLSMYVEDYKLYAREGVYFFPKEMFAASHAVTDKGYLLPGSTWQCEPRLGEKPTSVTFSTPVYGKRDVTQVTAYMQVRMDYSRVEALLSSLELSAQGEFWVLDRSGQVVAARCGENASPPRLPELPGGTVEHDGTCYVFARVQASGWYLAYRAEMGSLRDSSGYFQLLLGMLTMIIVFAVFFLVVILVIILVITNYYDKRMQNIAHSLSSVDITQAESSVYKKTSNLNLLANNTGKLILRVKELTEQSVRDKLAAQMAELKALQWQINPHFLYNALDIVNWAAIKRKDQDTSRIISLIARYFRLVLGGGHSNVPLSQELEFCRVYLQIQTEIDPGRFAFSVDSSGMVRDVVLPKMTVQPFVENALLHGVMKLQRRQGHIRVEVEQSSEYTAIRVADNGVGFDTTRLQLEAGDPEGFGVRNVYNRLELFLGSPPELNYSSDSKGTTVEVRMKL